jgi:hypothetical protein
MQYKPSGFVANLQVFRQHDGRDTAAFLTLKGEDTMTHIDFISALYYVEAPIHCTRAFFY